MNAEQARHLDRRIALSASALGMAEDASYSGDRPAPAGHSGSFQIALTYRGAFHWHSGGRKVLVDATRILFVTGGEDYSEDYPAPDGMASVVLTPAPAILEDVTGVDYAKLARHPSFYAQVRASRPDVALLTQQLRHADGLAAEELMVALLRTVLECDSQLAMPGARGRQLVDRAREFLHAQRSGDLGLTEIAAHVGVSGVYLIQLFKAVEGVPLHQYRLQLRLRRALSMLPDSSDITGIALDLGFSSHSHFSAAFRRAFGVTPSDFRTKLRRYRPGGSGARTDPVAGRINDPVSFQFAPSPQLR